MSQDSFRPKTRRVERAHPTCRKDIYESYCLSVSGICKHVSDFFLSVCLSLRLFLSRLCKTLLIFCFVCEFLYLSPFLLYSVNSFIYYCCEVILSILEVFLNFSLERDHSTFLFVSSHEKFTRRTSQNKSFLRAFLRFLN